MSAAVAAPVRGTVAIPEAKHSIPPTPEAEMQKALDALVAARDAWVATDVAARIRLLERLRRDTHRVAPRWVAKALQAKGIEAGTPTEAEEWLAGPMATLRNLRLLQETLESIQATGLPKPPGKPRALANGQVAVPVFPNDTFDKVLFQGFSAEIWMQEGVTLDNLDQHQAAIYREKAAGRKRPGKVALVLGAGNVSSIGPMDALYKLFAEDQVVILKMNPVNEYVGPFLEEAFAALVEEGFLRVVYGGAQEGAWLCQHDLVDEIHITGSDKTHDAIVFGRGEEGRKRKAEGKPLNTKRITSELGNVSTMIVVPGPWKDSDLAFQGHNIASSLTNNGGFNCNATRVVITHAGWEQRDRLLDAIRGALAEVPTRKAYYPGAAQRFELFLEEHPEAEKLGNPRAGDLPWTLIPGLDPAKKDDICFTTEAFCSVFGETALPAGSVVEYIDRAVEFANEGVWGTLNASIIVHPASLKDPAVAGAVERAVQNLRFGAVAVNHWPALAYAFGTTTWGAYPGHTMTDIQSGVGVVHNTYLYERPEKTVVRGPFRVFPKPPWFASHKNAHVIGRRLTDFEYEPSWLKVPGVVMAALKG